MERRLDDLCQKYWETVMEWNPVGATLLGDHRFDDRLPDLTVTAAEAQRQKLLRMYTEASKVATDGVNDEVTRAMLLHELQSEAELLDIDLVVAPCDPMLGPHSTLLRAAAITSVAEPSQARDAADPVRRGPRPLGAGGGSSPAPAGDGQDTGRRQCAEGAPPDRPVPLITRGIGPVHRGDAAQRLGWC